MVLNLTDFEAESDTEKQNFWERFGVFINANKVVVALVFLGLTFLGLGVFMYKDGDGDDII